MNAYFRTSAFDIFFNTIIREWEMLFAVKYLRKLRKNVQNIA